MNKLKTTKQILVIDLEATCWERVVPFGQSNEVIEIGVCVLDIETGLINKRAGILIRPQMSEVSAFCTRLTTITSELLEQKGILFSEACQLLDTEYNATQYIWASYGAYDLKMMKSQCAQMNVTYPLSADHINVKELFGKVKRLDKNVGMNGALKMLQLPLEGVHHRGVDDAKNIAKILNWCLKNKDSNENNDTK